MTKIEIVAGGAVCHLLASEDVKINLHKFEIMLIQYILACLGGCLGRDDRTSFLSVQGFISPFNC